MLFSQAKPVFPEGKENEKNCFATFRAEISSLREAVLHITAASFYQVYVNGRFLGFGPARTAKGYARVDQLPLDSLDSANGTNEIVIAVCGYNVCSLSTVRQPAFLLAEVRRGDDVLCCTGRDFTGYLPSCKLQKTERYSVQRHFTEVWDLRKGYDLTPENARVSLSVASNSPKPIERRAPYAFYEDRFLSNTASGGLLTFDASLPYRATAYSFQPDEQWGCFGSEEVVSHPFEWVQRRRQTLCGEGDALPVTLRENEYVILDFSRIETGFVLMNMVAQETADVVVAFSEDGSPSEFRFTRMNAHNVLEYLLPAEQEVNTLSFEPYVMRYAMVAVRSGSVCLKRFGIKTFMHDVSTVRYPKIENQKLAAIYRGAVRTFAHNAVDIYMDCPSRERAGWLCDSYFTAKTEYALFGNTKVEDAFLENFCLFQNEGEYPQGALPMCFPSDAHNGKFIPQWTMWFILEVEEYLNRRNPAASVEKFRPCIEALLDFYKRYENEDGLLESLPSWNFVEWSRANDWTQDVSYPTNFLYAEVLAAAYRLFGDEIYHMRCEEVRKKTVEQSFNGTVFLDHAIRDEHHHLVRQNDCSEACQYYAILFGGINMNDAKFAKLRHLVTNVFGAVRKEEMPEIIEVDAFIGVYLRLEALLKMKEHSLLLRDVENFFGEMEAKTGTLWEYRTPSKSLDHGFASYALVAIEKALKKTDA